MKIFESCARVSAVEIDLSDRQLERLSEFCANLALVFLASIVAPFFSNVDLISIERVDAFYIAGAILLLAIAIIVFPTLRRRSKR